MPTTWCWRHAKPAWNRPKPPPAGKCDETISFVDASSSPRQRGAGERIASDGSGTGRRKPPPSGVTIYRTITNQLEFRLRTSFESRTFEFDPSHLKTKLSNEPSCGSVRCVKSLREPRRYPPSWVGALCLSSRSFWVNCAGKCFATESRLSTGAAIAPLRCLREHASVDGQWSVVSLSGFRFIVA